MFGGIVGSREWSSRKGVDVARGDVVVVLCRWCVDVEMKPGD